MLVIADHPISQRFKVGDLTVNVRRPIPFCDHRMAMRNQMHVCVEIQRATMPENQRQISSRQTVPCGDRSQVRVENQETDQAQEERNFQRLQVKAARSSGRGRNVRELAQLLSLSGAGWLTIFADT